MQTHGTHVVRPVEFIVLTASIMLLTAVAIDIMLPAFDTLRNHFGLGPESTATAQIVTFFFLGQVGQLIFGPLSDRYGRLPILRAGFVLYIGGCIVAALAPTLEAILAARFVVGMGAAAMSVSAFAGVRDRLKGDTMARTMSFVLTIFLLVPIVAPIAGSAILRVASWQAVFLTPAIVAGAVFVWSLRLNESLPKERRHMTGLAPLFRSAQEVVQNWNFVRYTAITTILFGSFTSYIGSSERIISEIYKQPELFVWIFAGVGMTMACFAFFNTYLVARFGARRTAQGLILAYLIVASALIGLTIMGQGLPNLFVLFTFIAILQGITVAAEPNSSALALEPLGFVAGTAAAIYGTSFLVVGALIGSYIDRLLIDSVLPLVGAYTISGLVAVILMHMGRSSTTPASATTSMP